MLAATQKRVVIIRGFIRSRDRTGAPNSAAVARASTRFSDLKKIFLHCMRAFPKKRQTSQPARDPASIARRSGCRLEARTGENRGINRRIRAIRPPDPTRCGAGQAPLYNKLTPDLPQFVSGENAETARRYPTGAKRRSSAIIHRRRAHRWPRAVGGSHPARNARDRRLVRPVPMQQPGRWLPKLH
jgi:hypothetical protein